jgi:hypothetical protein
MLHYVLKEVMDKEKDKVYVCPRCHYETDVKGNIMRHIGRKSLCPSTYSDCDKSTILRHLDQVPPTSDNRRFVCTSCNKSFTTKSNLNAHIRNVHKKPVVDVDAKDTPKNSVDIVLHKLLAIVENMENNQRLHSNNSHNINSHNIIQNNNIQIVVQQSHRADFGQEHTGHIDDDCIKDAISNLGDGFVDMVNKIHYDPNVPENNNIAFKSSKQKQFWVIKNGLWQAAPQDCVVQQMCRKISGLMYNRYLEGLSDNDPDIKRFGETYHDWHVGVAEGKGNKYWSLRNKIVSSVQNQTAQLNPVLQDRQQQIVHPLHSGK